MAVDAFLRMILDDPTDDAPRLVFADWLEENGQEDRAAWIRASCRRATVHSDHPEFHEVWQLVRETFDRCRPAWWQSLTGVEQWNDRGLFRFKAGSKAALNRLGKAGWLAQAASEGWLEGIFVTWCDGSMVRLVTSWKEPVRGVPLFARPAPQISDDGLAAWLAVPRLWGLELPCYALRNPAARRLGQRRDLRELRLEDLGHCECASAILEQLGLLGDLRRLTLDGCERPNDDDLRQLGGLSELRELTFSRCGALTAAGLTALRPLGKLKSLRMWGCRGISSDELPALQAELGGIHIEYL